MSPVFPVFAILYLTGAISTVFVWLSLWSGATFSVSAFCSPQFLRIVSLSGSFLCQPIMAPLVTFILTASTVNVIVVLSTVLSISLLLFLFLSFETGAALFF